MTRLVTVLPGYKKKQIHIHFKLADLTNIKLDYSKRLTQT